MKTFADYINEQRLDELGDSFRPYSYSSIRIEIPHDRYFGTAAFKTTSGTNYRIKFESMPHGRNNEVSTSVEFLAKNAKNVYSYNSTDAGLEEAFRVVATVIKCTQEYCLKLFEKHGEKTTWIHFLSAENTKTGVPSTDELGHKKARQRDKLYNAFIKKAFPSAKIHGAEFPGDMVVIELPKRMYFDHLTKKQK